MRTIDYNKLQKAVEKMNNEGIMVDMNKVDEVADKYYKELAQAQARLDEITEKYGMLVEVNSVKQVKTLIYDSMKFKPSMQRKGKELVPNYSTTAQVLEYVRKVNKNHEGIEVLDLISKIRSLNKLLNWVESLKAAVFMDGKLYCTHHIDGTVSGRFTCTGTYGKVNFHAIPREFKDVFVA